MVENALAIVQKCQEINKRSKEWSVFIVQEQNIIMTSDKPV